MTGLEDCETKQDLIRRLRDAPQKVGTFGRGDPQPLDEYRPAMTGAERDWLVSLLEERA